MLRAPMPAPVVHPDAKWDACVITERSELEIAGETFKRKRRSTLVSCNASSGFARDPHPRHHYIYTLFISRTPLQFRATPLDASRFAAAGGARGYSIFADVTNRLPRRRSHTCSPTNARMRIPRDCRSFLDRYNSRRVCSSSRARWIPVAS